MYNFSLYCTVRDAFGCNLIVFCYFRSFVKDGNGNLYEKVLKVTYDGMTKKIGKGHALRVEGGRMCVADEKGNVLVSILLLLKKIMSLFYISIFVLLKVAKLLHSFNQQL